MEGLKYISLINNFWRVEARRRNFTPAATALYFYLLEVCNGLGWKNPFNYSGSVLSDFLNISKNTLIEARRKLVDIGLILYEPTTGRGNFGTYTILPPAFLPATAGQDSAPDDTEEAAAPYPDPNRETDLEKGQEKGQILNHLDREKVQNMNLLGKKGSIKGSIKGSKCARNIRLKTEDLERESRERETHAPAPSSKISSFLPATAGQDSGPDDTEEGKGFAEREEDGTERPRTRTATFAPPTLQQVRDYFAKYGFTDPENFFGYYTANGWTQGGRPVVSWKGLAVRWANNGIRPKDSGKPPDGRQQQAQPPQQPRRTGPPPVDPAAARKVDEVYRQLREKNEAERQELERMLREKFGENYRGNRGNG